MGAIDATCPHESHARAQCLPGRDRGFYLPGHTQACKLAGVPHYHPHDLRHRRLTIWHQAGVPAREVAHRAGHSRTSESLDTYSHVMPLDEVPAERVQGLFLEGQRRMIRCPGGVSVVSRRRKCGGNPHK
jgi:integrase